VWGVDIDGCCDAVTGKFTPESREIVIALDSYGEYSPSGTGCHVLGTRPAARPRHQESRTPGAKAVEVKADGYYFTFTGPPSQSKTPSGPAWTGKRKSARSMTALYAKLGGSKRGGLNRSRVPTG
jgi:primase-polymerase (primpol)-like protein